MKKFGFGTMRLPLISQEDKTSIDQGTFNAMADAFLDAGFTYFDTAYMYHDEMSESALKKAVVDRYDREKFLIADKMPLAIVRKPEDYPRFFETQLERTGAGYFDFYLLHNMGKDRYAQTVKFGGFDFIKEKISEGKIRKFGFSFHDDAQTLDRILTEHPEVDFVQLQINYLDWENEVIQSRKCYETAVKHGKKVVVMEPVKGGLLANLPEEAMQLLKDYNPDASAASYALRFVGQLEHVMMVLSGMSAMEHMEDNIRVMEDVKPLNEEEMALLQKVVEIVNKSVAIPCTGCGYCMEVCPQRIAIPGLFGLYNNYKVSGNFSNMYYNRIVFDKGKASDCLGCRLCERNCPQHISIPEHLETISKFEK